MNRQNCFLDPRDYRSYVAALRETATHYSVAVHAYVLMTNHVHILATPDTDWGASRMMQQLGRKYVSYFNKAHMRTGALWEGRFRSSMITSLRYLFACYRYIELNPVRAGLVSSPEEYEWSSYRCNALGRCNGLIKPHRAYLALEGEPAARSYSYRRLFVRADADADEVIRIANQKGRTL